jgi:hypothetical protein
MLVPLFTVYATPLGRSAQSKARLWTLWTTYYAVNWSMRSELLTSIIDASIFVYYTDAVVNRSIASALVNHPALCTFSLYYEASVLQAYLTVLSTIPKLEKVTFSQSLVGELSEFLSSNETEALVAVMRIDRPLSVEFQLGGRKFSDPASHRHFCAGFAEAKVKGVRISVLILNDAVT